MNLGFTGGVPNVCSQAFFDRERRRARRARHNTPQPQPCETFAETKYGGSRRQTNRVLLLLLMAQRDMKNM